MRRAPMLFLFFLVLVLALGTVTVRAEVRRLPKPLGIVLGMTVGEATQLLAKQSARLRTHADDKPFPGESQKVRARLPEGAEARKLTLYFVKQRLWQIKVRHPSAVLRKSIEAGLGTPDHADQGCRRWWSPKQLQAVSCCKEACYLADLGQWVRAGKQRAEAQKAFARIRRTASGSSPPTQAPPR